MKPPADIAKAEAILGPEEVAELRRAKAEGWTYTAPRTEVFRPFAQDEKGRTVTAPSNQVERRD